LPNTYTSIVYIVLLYTLAHFLLFDPIMATLVSLRALLMVPKLHTSKSSL
jgi:hypothetical protein